jgi:DNA-binding NtrC family response regulator
MKLKVLIIDDDKDFCSLLTEVLEKNDCAVKSHYEAKNVLEAVKGFEPNVILLDVVMPNKSGLEILKEIKASTPNIPVMMVSSREDAKIIVTAMKAGATDYIPKSVGNEELISKIRKIHEMTMIKDTEDKLVTCSEIIGNSNSTKNLINMIGIVAQSDMPVFLKGESGTGKSFVAEIIHKYSKRKSGPFATINCPAISPMLLESELFGHEKGSFTGAIKTTEGKFDIADGGTVFLDEIGCLTTDLQVKILRVIQNKEFEKVGGLKTKKVDVRIIAATNMDLEKGIKDGQFRDDLYYRLNVLPIYIPPLRERKQDIPLLVEQFLKLATEKENKKFNALSNEVMDVLTSYEWPGNIRELENSIQRAVVVGKEPNLKASDFSLTASLRTNVTPGKEKVSFTSLKDMEYDDLVDALKGSSGNVSQAAKILGISRVALYRRMKKHGIGLKG